MDEFKKIKHNDNYEKVLPTRLRGLMEQRGMTQSDLASRIGLTRAAVSQYCRGGTSPDWETLCHIAKVLESSVDYLVGLTDCVTPNMECRAVCDYTGLSEAALDALLGADWFVELVGSDGETLLDRSGEPLRLPHDGLFLPEVLSMMLEDPEFLQILGNLSLQTREQYRLEREKYDSTTGQDSVTTENGVITRRNPAMSPFTDPYRDLLLGGMARHFANVAERLLTRYETEHPLDLEHLARYNAAYHEILRRAASRNPQADNPRDEKSPP